MKLLLLFLSLLSAAVHAGEPATLNVKRWDYARWITPGKPFVVEFELKADSAEKATQLLYANSKGEIVTTPCSLNPALPRSYSATLGPFETPTAETMTFWIEQGGTARSDEQTIPFSTIQEIEISGHTGDKLVYALNSWKADILFTPCCYIPSAFVSCEILTASPSGSVKGLPKALLSPFVNMTMDDMVKATGGLQLRATIDQKRLASIRLETIKAYQWKDGEWQAILEPLIDRDGGTITFFFAYGGYCVVAAEPKA